MLKNTVKKMTMNGRLIARVTGESEELIDDALAHGALAAGISGTGPAIAVVAESGKGGRIAEALERQWSVSLKF